MKAILTYHSLDDSRSPISVSPAAFRRHVAQFVAAGIPVLTVDELLARDDTDDAVALTFDDGYVSVEREAAPVLTDHGLPATVFAVTRYVGQTNAWAAYGGHDVPTLPLLDWQQLGRLQEQGVAIGSHTRTHPRLPELSTRQIEDEIHGAATDITSAMGTAPVGFAYPYGDLSLEASAAVSKVHRWACSTSFGALSRPDPLALPRLDMWYFEKRGLLEQWGTPAFRRWVERRRRLRGVRSVLQRLVGR